jgi:hypothetical protein
MRQATTPFSTPSGHTGAPQISRRRGYHDFQAVLINLDGLLNLLLIGIMPV